MTKQFTWSTCGSCPLVRTWITGDPLHVLCPHPDGPHGPLSLIPATGEIPAECPAEDAPDATEQAHMILALSGTLQDIAAQYAEIAREMHPGVDEDMAAAVEAFREVES